ncbi:quinone oxidoreductase [Ramlibacter sp.]|uniref:quinone oxidoreductase family protein n=1 Tax=Ramlibacter sp. TaxID=1917967 RepID=UPI0026048885|nr:quinone oxidoreductase [Ramlibacter sp.]MDB5956764.1 quinone oxidoreductase [Ramlibacter sp.]
MPQAILLEEYGGPEVLRPREITVAAPGPGEVRLRQTWIGVNFHDVYVRTGQYRTLTPPGIPGIEAVGVIEQVGTGVDGLRVGDRVGYVTRAYGCYASERLLPARIAVPLPPHVDDRTAASVLLKGLTVEMLVQRVHRIAPGEWVLVQAAAGGVGQLLVQWARQLGARVIGTVGSQPKVQLARAAGCEQVILYREEDVAARVAEITGGRGVDVVYDGVGHDSFAGSLASLAMCAHLVNFGQASGPVPPLALSDLQARSTTVSRPVVFHYAAQPGALQAMSAALFDALARGWLRVPAAIEFPLAEAAAAHALLEARSASRPIILKT